MNNNRRSFLKLTQAAALPVGAALATHGIARADDGDVKEFLGSWNTKHSLPPPYNYFREFLSFSSGGVVHETNSFLNTANNLDFTAFGFPGILNASDGFGNWERIAKGVIKVAFRKMLFDSARQNIGDLRAYGTLHSNGSNLTGSDWRIDIVAPFTNSVIKSLGNASTEGFRID